MAKKIFLDFVLSLIDVTWVYCNSLGEKLFNSDINVKLLLDWC
jgi:hypothetical protein